MFRVPPHPPSRLPAPAVLALAAAAQALALTACGTPPGLEHAGRPSPATGATLPSPSAASPAGRITPTVAPSAPTAAPSASGFPESYAVDCGGRPSGAQVVRALRRSEDLLPAGARVTVDTGPLCAGTWQYTVVTVPGREPLVVVTRGTPGQLELVTAGSNVCSVPVRANAPTGIKLAADC